MATCLAGCAGPAQISNFVTTKENLRIFAAATQNSVTCGATAGANSAYLALNAHMPLDDIGRATLPQMTDAAHAARDDVVSLDAWNRAINFCRARLLATTDAILPGFGPLIERGRDEDDAVFVRLAQQKIGWGDAVMALKTNRTKLHGDIIAKADQVDAELNRMQQDQLDRQTTLLSSAIRILP